MDQRIWNYLISQGLSPCGAAGLMGNLQAESALNPKNLQNSFEAKLGMDNDSYTAAVDDGSYGNFVHDCAGYGLAQWTYWNRKEALLKSAQAAKTSIGDLDMQLRFMVNELRGSYPAVWSALESASDIGHASDIVLTQYECPADQGEAQRTKRAGYAQNIYDKFMREARDMVTANEKRLAVVKKYEEILGRNNYSQDLRDYCYRKHSNGKYYSDCSSSISYAYKEAGFSFGILNTVGMYTSAKLRDVAVVIKNGIIQNKEVLRPGDMLLFARTNSSRAHADYVGHVEMVAKINGDKVTIYGHGSGTPRATDMDTYCKNQFAKKTNTRIGNKGLLKVRRFIWDGDDGIYIARGMEGAEVKKLQENLMRLGYSLPKYGADGDFGSETEIALKAFQTDKNLPVTGIYDAATDKAMQAALGTPVAPEPPAEEPETPVTGDRVKITGGTVNVRSGPGKQYHVLDVAKNGETYPAVVMDGWKAVDMGSMVGWVSDTYSEVVKGG